MSSSNSIGTNATKSNGAIPPAGQAAQSNMAEQIASVLLSRGVSPFFMVQIYILPRFSGIGSADGFWVSSKQAAVIISG